MGDFHIETLDVSECTKCKDDWNTPRMEQFQPQRSNKSFLCPLID